LTVNPSIFAPAATSAFTTLGAYSTTTNGKSAPGAPGGGAGGSDTGTLTTANGAEGAVRIIWGFNRSFPSTNTLDM
jgi:hypothetical protein